VEVYIVDTGAGAPADDKYLASLYVGGREYPMSVEDIERVTRRLHEEMEHLDPSDEPKEWETLNYHIKECYAACVIEIVAAIGDQLANRCPTTI
jgi:hypothetical protein